LKIKRLTVLVTAAALAMSLATPVSAASPNGKADAKAHGNDNRPGKLAQKQAALKQKGLEKVLKGQAKATGKNKVVKVAKGQFVELAFEGEDQVLTFLGEFGDTPATHDHGEVLGTINHGGTAGPSHNQIPEPNRHGVDNTTIWTSDFSQSYYDNLLYNKAQKPSMANWYLEQSYGRYSVDGFVSDWVRVPNNEAAYGSNYCGDIVCTRDIGRFLVDQADAWCTEQTDVLHKTQAEIDEMLATFDVWDRYDYDGDGNFDEPDGYIDHFQSVHAGVGEETGGGAQGTDAIWSHRSYANAGQNAPLGPDVAGVHVPFGGLSIPCSDKWIGDYTIEPENGGVGVFSHEFGHDLGLPDEYDTSGNTGGAENSTAWWTPWSQGSYGTVNGVDLGSSPVDATAFERLVLGWSNGVFADYTDSLALKLSASNINTKQAQSLVVVLPDKEITKDVGAPFAGSKFYYSGAADSLNTTMTRSITFPSGGSATLTAQARWNIEEGFDYAYLMIDGNVIHTNLSNSSVLTDGIEGSSGGNWQALTADVSAYADGAAHQVRFGYSTDGGVQGATTAFAAGFAVDDLSIPGQPVDGAESDPGWTFASNQDAQRFHITTGTETFSYLNAYIAEYRNYGGYDQALKLGPYNFDDPDGDWVTHFPFQDGLLIWYYDTSFADNNVGDHPGEGLILPVDAHPAIMHYTGGTTPGAVVRVRLQSYDSTFGLDKTDAFTLTGTAIGTLNFPSRPAVRTFDDNQSHYTASDPGDALGHYQAGWISVNHPHTGTVIKVASVSGQGNFMQVILNP
jgi:immune inhibitor A